MTNTGTLSTSNKNTNNCGRLKYILRTIQTKNYYCLNLRKIQTQHSKTDANLERESEIQTDRQIDRQTESNRQKDVCFLCVRTYVRACVRADRQTETERDRDRQTDTQRETDTDRLTDGLNFIII